MGDISWQGRIVLIYILILMSVMLLGLRIWIHRKMGVWKSLPVAISDSFLMFTLICYIGVAISMDIRLWELRTHDAAYGETKHMLNYGPAQGVIYVCMLWSTKAAFLSFYFSLNRYITPWYRYALYGGGIFLFTTWAINFLMALVYCRPFSTMVNFGPDYCSANTERLPATILFACNVISDMAIMVLGLLVIRKLSLGKQQMAAVVFVVGIGCIPIIASAVRYEIINTVLSETNLAKQLSEINNLLLWSQLDAQFAFYATCLPALRAFIRRKPRKTQPKLATGTIGGSGAPRSHGKSLLSSIHTKREVSVTVEDASWGAANSRSNLQQQRPASLNSRGSSDNVELLTVQRSDLTTPAPAGWSEGV